MYVGSWVACVPVLTALRDFAEATPLFHYAHGLLVDTRVETRHGCHRSDGLRDQQITLTLKVLRSLPTTVQLNHRCLMT
jgi:hypothetical protein